MHLKILIFLVMTILRTSSKFVFQVTTEEHSLLSFVCKLSLPLLSLQKSVHKRITVFSKHGQGKNKEMFVFNEH